MSADEELCRAMGSEYARLPESYRTSSGTRIIDDVRDMRDFFGWTASVDELLARRESFFREACASVELVPMPGVVRVIRELRANAIALAITSSAVRGSIETILGRLALRASFALIVDGSEVERGKPDPEAYVLTARKLGIAPRACVVFEDSHIGVAAAKAAGMLCVAVRNPRAKSRQDLSAADVVLQSFDDVDVGVLVAIVR